MRSFLLATVAAIAVCLAGSVPARGGCQGSAFTFCSMVFHAQTVCNGMDQVAAISGNHCPAGQSCQLCPTGKDCPLIQPWEPTPIKIVGVEIAVSWGSISYAFAGNNYQPDPMAFMGAGQTHRQQWFPQGLSFAMPAAGTPTAASPHIDLHVSCPKATAKRCFFCWKRKAPRPNVVVLYYTIYYTVP
jgi:hypothetical protein